MENKEFTAASIGVLIGFVFFTLPFLIDKYLTIEIAIPHSWEVVSRDADYVCYEPPTNSEQYGSFICIYEPLSPGK